MNRIQRVKIQECLRGPRRADTFISVFLLLLFAAVVAFETYTSVWELDSITYAYVYPEDETAEHFETRHIETIGDIFESQHRHFFNTNGRLPVHFLVQLFCGWFGSRIPFVIANTIVWVALICLFVRVARFRNGFSAWNLAVTFALLTMIFPGEKDPAFQINYVWSCTIYLIWYALFISGFPDSGSRYKKAAGIALVFIVGIAAGWSNEAFSLPVCGALLTSLILKRGRFTPKEWAAAAGVAVGVIPIVLSPAVYVRLDMQSGISPREIVVGLIEFLWPAWLLLLILLTSARPRFASFSKLVNSTKFGLWVCVFSILFAAFVGASIKRVLNPANLYFAYLTVRCIEGRYRLNNLWKWVIIAISLGYNIVVSTENIRAENYRDLVAGKVDALRDTDSIVWMSRSEIDICRSDFVSVYRWRRWAKDNSLPMIYMAPEELKNISFGRDTNALVKIDDSHWLIVQSKTEPARFIVDRKVALGNVGVGLPPRVIELRRGEDCYIMETEYWRAGVYVPRNALLQAEVSMIPAHGGSGASQH